MLMYVYMVSTKLTKKHGKTHHVDVDDNVTHVDVCTNGINKTGNKHDKTHHVDVDKSVMYVAAYLQ